MHVQPSIPQLSIHEIDKVNSPLILNSQALLLAIFTSLIFSKSLWLRITNTKTLHQSQRIKFKSFSFYETSLDSWIMVILKNMMFANQEFVLTIRY